MAEPILPEDSLIRLTLSNGDGLIGMTLMEHREHRAPTAVGALAKSDGFQVKEENHGLEGRWICMDLLVASLQIITSCYNFSVHSGYKMIQPHICNEGNIYDMLGKFNVFGSMLVMLNHDFWVGQSIRIKCRQKVEGMKQKP